MSKNSNEDSALNAALLFTIFPALIVVRGFLFCVLWGWFVVPTLHAPQLSWGGAMGLSLTAGMMLGTGSSNAEDKDATFAGLLFKGVVKYVAVFIMGWALHFAV